jgi:hypothetical protein
VFATIVIFAILLAALWVTFARCVAASFAYVLLPSLLLVFNIPTLDVPVVPDLNPLTAVGYGTMAGFLIKGGEPLRFRLHVIDLLVILLSVVAAVSNAFAENLWGGVSKFGQDFFGWLIPYFMARMTLTQPYYRLRSAQMLAGLAIFIAPFALWETRIDPTFYARKLMMPFGLTTVAWELVLKRFGYARAQASFSHPIDLGIGGAIIACLIIVLATTTGRKLTTPWVLAGTCAGGVMTLCSLSFTSFVAVAAILAIFLAARLTRFVSIVLLPMSVGIIVAYVLFTAYLIETPVELPETEEQVYSSSYYMRHVIIQKAWPEAQSAGWFGHGTTWDVATTGLYSLDNSYMLFIIRHGWLYFACFLLLLTAVNIYGGTAISQVRDGRARTPVAAGVGGLVGTMLSMYTVFFGFVYARLFIILLGLSVTMFQMVFERTRRMREHPAGFTGPVPRQPPARLAAPGRRRVARAVFAR